MIPARVVVGGSIRSVVCGSKGSVCMIFWLGSRCSNCFKRNAQVGVFPVGQLRPTQVKSGTVLLSTHSPASCAPPPAKADSSRPDPLAFPALGI
ncbi:MAG: hypothetical protein ACI81P_003122 [Neolewinella sp.]|jgi:hypothetical protein